MEILQAIILGIVEGLTEFLPISSTGHLVIAQDLINYRDTSKMFTVVIQMGAIFAVIWFYRQQLWSLLRGLAKSDKTVRRFWLVWVLATIPAGLAGLFFDTQIEAYAVAFTVAIALILGGIAIILIEKYHRPRPVKNDHQMYKITPKQAALVGLYQILALVPGVSRSGATIMGGLLSGLDRLTATAFSFFLGIPIILVAGIYKLMTDNISTVAGGGIALVAGLAASFVTALFVIGWLLKYVSRHDFRVFAYYRIVFGLLILLLIGAGWLG